MEKNRNENNRKNPLNKSFGYAFEGIRTGIRKERNMKIHCLAVIAVTVAGTFLHIKPVEWCICLLLFGLILSLELVNTALEAVVDLVTKEKKTIGEDRERYSGRGGSCIGDRRSDHRMHYFCSIFVRIDKIKEIVYYY